MKRQDEKRAAENLTRARHKFQAALGAIGSACHDVGRLPIRTHLAGLNGQMYEAADHVRRVLGYIDDNLARLPQVEDPIPTNAQLNGQALAPVEGD